MGGGSNPQGANTPSLGEVVSPRTAALLDWMEERGFTEDERARVTAALDGSSIVVSCPAAYVVQRGIRIAAANTDWFGEVAIYTSQPGFVRLFGVFTPLARPPPVP